MASHLFLCLIFIFVTSIIGDRFFSEQKIRKLGGRAPQILTYLPFGLDLIYEWLKKKRSHLELEFIEDKFAKHSSKSPCPEGQDVQSWTIEATALGRRAIFTVDPENVKHILLNNSNVFIKGKGFHQRWKGFLGNAIFTTSEGLWHDSRRKIRPLYSKARVSSEGTFKMFERYASKVIKRFEESKQEANQEANIQDIFSRLAMDIATDFLLDNSLDTFGGLSQDFRQAYNLAWREQEKIAVIGPRLYPQKSFHANMEIISSFFSASIQRKMCNWTPKEAKTSATFLDELIASGHSKEFIQDEISSQFFATQLMGPTFSWLFFELSTKPEVVAAIRSEIMAVLGETESPTYEDLKNRLPYLNCNINEILRLYPPNWLNFREATCDTSLPVGGGADGSLPVGVPKGTLLATSVLVLQRRKDLYPPITESSPDPNVFAPNRWQNWRPRAWHYLPFSGGQRSCVGQQFSLLMLGFIVCKVLQRFPRFELSERSDTPKLRTGGTLEMEGKVLLRFADTVDAVETA
ncbi:MAG: hypothetical protein M1821_009531 [Bathelium mastoideum]|nr:MAG: hypothetical protein M1821_009531 [Bathelium mastoideum]KAI9688754.1 MAG: hypothetical protein M1822_001111 [Bathelium mastoideum]